MICVLWLSLDAEAQSMREQIQGIWRMDQNLQYAEESWDKSWGNNYYIFNNNRFLFIDAYEKEIFEPLSVYTMYFGFSNEYMVDNIDSLFDSGKYFVKTDDSTHFYPSSIGLSQKESLFFCYNDCSYLERLPKKVQLVLYKRSLYDHCNYAREFLEYDICGIKVDNVQLLDSLQNATGTIINKDDIAVVRDTTGDLLQVEYEPEPNKYIKGYLKREDLQFVETKK